MTSLVNICGYVSLQIFPSTSRSPRSWGDTKTAPVTEIYALAVLVKLFEGGRSLGNNISFYPRLLCLIGS